MLWQFKTKMLKIKLYLHYKIEEKNNNEKSILIYFIKPCKIIKFV